MTADSTLDRIGQAVGSRSLLAEIWTEIGGEQGDPLHVCVLAHLMADTQDDVHDELLWDERALAAAAYLTDDRVAQAGVPMTVAALYPSLHLSLADCHRKLGDLDRARDYLERARSGMHALGDNAYGQLIRDGLRQLDELLTID